MSQHNETKAPLEALEQQVSAFIAANLTEEMVEGARLGFGISRELGTRWHQAIHQQGWIAPDWPVEYGGTGWGIREKQAFSDAMALAGAPMIMPFGIGMVGPVIYTFGTQAQKDQHLPSILDGSTWWCQGYSEPGSGSDLASLKTSAVRDGDHYVVNGQKIWTTNAHKADWIFALVRTDPDAKAQRGISFLLIDMKTPGLEVKPIVSIDGMHHLNQVFFEDVRVPVENLVGEENAGWTYAKFLLGNERAGIANVAASKRLVGRLKEIAKAEGDGMGESLSQSSDFMMRLASVEVQLNALAAQEARVIATMESTGSPGDAASMLKIIGSEVEQNLHALRVEAIGYYSLPFEVSLIRGESNLPAPGPDYAVSAVADMNFSRAASIYGGSNEIQRNVMAKGVLGL
ncbi:MAG TPA: pimeloyl-CoA dehydrogenase large subunit [Gammaproteobacteria bacterium]|jgi:alkylation response protein AidB-like acyl-CoA dehydrogenase|nr:pimeloyl-CoA dehydrogenase large subunit [Gammaproteobacteria bacterium]